MRDERPLGWYNLQGTAYVSLDVIRDPTTLTTVLNHEKTHFTLAATTPYGLLQQAIETHLHLPWDKERSSRLPHCRNLLFDASRLVQEAAATSCGLAGLDGEELNTAEKSLPPFYQKAYRIFEDLLPRDGTDRQARTQAIRAVAARALQTGILEDWLAFELHDPGTLRAYLAEPTNAPDGRLQILVDEFAKSSPHEVASWAGRHLLTSEGERIRPELPPPLDGLAFVGFPAPDLLEERMLGIVGTLTTAVSRESVRVAFGGFKGFAIRPAVTGSRRLPYSEVTVESCPGVDFVLVDKNTFDGPIELHGGDGEFVLPARHFRVLAYRPDSRVPVEFTGPIDQLGAALDAVDPDRTATACVGSGMSLLPTDTGRAPNTSLSDMVTEELGRWASGRATLLCTLGDVESLIFTVHLLEGQSSRLLNHALLIEREWGLVLFRGADRGGPVIVHPTLLVDWQVVHPTISTNSKIEFNHPAADFFADHRDVLPIVRFARAFVGDAHAPQRWDEHWAMAASMIVGAPQVNAVSGLQGVEFEYEHQEG
ncbi:hypothetical protein [Actinokineospora diospyrosa]|uniref:Uncharacterized protein n=1 Tax=Actinokineospora diospyrosa TaxID=103728 RepID=A0ABT1IBK4_9PSEU|nr:hypothetical protein [Actinokineospora diospyrosa]MCP2270014.1 hypothetical protein [Actinokineospora diospyrosa]